MKEAQKSFPFIHSFRLPSGKNIIYADAYSLPLDFNEFEAYESSTGILPDKTMVPYVFISEKSTRSEPFLIGVSTKFEDLISLVDRGWLAGRRKFFVAALFFDGHDDKEFIMDFLDNSKNSKISFLDFAKSAASSIPVFGPTQLPFLATVIDWLAELFNKENKLISERIEKQRMVVYHRLFNCSRGLVIFWKDRNPTWHLLVDYDAFDQNTLSTLGSLVCRGLGEPFPFTELFPKNQSEASL